MNRLISCALGLSVACLPGNASAASVTCEGWLVFMSDKTDPQWDIYGMAPDGSGLVNISNDPGVLALEPTIDGTGSRVSWYGGPGGNAAIYKSHFDGSGKQAVIPDGNVVSPAYSPDGQYVAYVYPGGEQLWYQHVDGTGATYLTSGSWPDWHPCDNKIVFGKWASGTIGSIRVVDVATMATTILTPGGQIKDLRPEYSPDGSLIVFDRTVNGAADIMMMNADGTGIVNLTAPLGLSDSSSASWSPDGSQLAFAYQDDIWIMDADGTNPVQVTNTPWEESAVYWGHRSDGLLVFHSNQFDSQYDIMGMRPDATGAINISNDISVISYEPTVSADGELVGHYGGPGGNASIFGAAPDGSGQVTIVNGGNAVTPAFSNDGTRVAWVYVGGEKIYYSNMDGTGATFLIDGSWPDWHPCDDSILYSKWGSGGVGSIRVVDLATTAITILTPGLQGSGFKDIHPEFSPDGARVAFTRIGTSSTHIVCMNADGTGVVDLSVSNGLDGDSPSWSPDGSRLAFMHNGDVWVMDIDGSNAHVVHSSSSVEGSVYWGPTEGCVFGQPWFDLGLGLAGTNGLPQLSGSGPLIGGCAYGVDLIGAKVNSTSFLVLGLTKLNAPLKGGVLVPQADVVVGFATDASGELHITGTFPAGIPSHTKTWMQFWIPDPAATLGYAASNGLKLVTP